jgi:alpha-L-rhamnosidase
MIATIPANTVAEIHLPAADPSQVYEQERPVAEAKGVTFLRREQNRCVFETGSGRYQFRIAAKE